MAFLRVVSTSLSLTSTVAKVSHNEGNAVRVVLIDNEPWFVAKDVCRALEIVNPTRTLARLDDNEKRLHSVNTPGGVQETNVINETGVYSLILTSRKPEAKAFKRWITRDVIPSTKALKGAYVGSLTYTNWQAPRPEFSVFVNDG